MHRRGRMASYDVIIGSVVHPPITRLPTVSDEVLTRRFQCEKFSPSWVAELH